METMGGLSKTSGSVKCLTEACGAHEYVVSSLDKMERLSEKLSDGQAQLQIGLVKLTENMEEVRRLHERLDKVEATQGTLKAFMWKVTGAITALTALPVLWQVVQFLNG